MMIYYRFLRLQSFVIVFIKKRFDSSVTLFYLLFLRCQFVY